MKDNVKRGRLTLNRRIIALFIMESLFLLHAVIGAILSKNEALYVWDSMEQAEAKSIRLRHGTYRVEMQFTDDGESQVPGVVRIETEEGGYKSVLSNEIPVFAGAGYCILDFTVSAQDAVIRIVSEREESLDFTAVRLVKTKAVYYKRVFVIIFLMLLFNLFLFAKKYEEQYGMPDSAKAAGMIIPSVTLIASLPSLTDYQIWGADLIFHMMRMEALKHSITSGELQVRLQSYWLAGHGYANSFFYCDTFLFLPAFMMAMGFTFDFAFRFFIITIHFLTACIAYYCFGKMFKDNGIGLLGCILYTLAPYRIFNCYNRAAIGEFVAMAFFPLLIYGFYKIYADDHENYRSQFNFVIPVIGFSGIIQSHMLSCEMVGIFTVICCLILWKKTFQKRIFIQLYLVVITTVLVNAWYLIPCIDLMISDNYYFQRNAYEFIQGKGVYPWQIFYTLQAAGNSSNYRLNGFMEAEPINMGIALLSGVLISVCLLWKKKWDEREKEMKHAEIVILVLLGLSLFMSTNLFPWDFLSVHGLKHIVGPLQFPTRFTALVTIFAVTASCIGISKLNKKTVLLGISVLSVLFAFYQTGDIAMTKERQLRIYDGKSIGTSAVLGAEYLPEGSEISHMTYHSPIVSEGIQYSDYKKDGLRAEMKISASAQDGKNGYVDFPMLYYKGYRAYDKNTGAKLEVGPGENYDVRVFLPKDFQGTLFVEFAGTWYWHLAEGISILTGLLLMVTYVAVHIAEKSKRIISI